MNIYRSLSKLLLIVSLFSHSYLYAQVDEMMGAHNFLLGKTGTGHDLSRASSLSFNPAHISEITRPSINAATGVQYYMYSYRFIGDTEQSTSSFGIDGIPLPTIVYPVTKSLIFGGFIVPIPVPMQINAKKVPMGLFGQLNHADFDGKATLKFFVNLYANIFKTSLLSVGAFFNYTSFEADVGVKASGYTGDNLVDVNIGGSFLSVKLGVKAKVFSRLYLGLSSTLFSSTSTSYQMNTVLNEDSDGDGSPDPSDKTTSSSSIPIKNLRLGATIKAHPRVLIYVDGDYQRNASTKQFSLVDLVEKDKDVSDTLSAYFGLEYLLNPKYQILAGGFYEPASVGHGGQGAGEKTGFGFMDLAMSLGEPPTLPAWGGGVGVRMGFMKIRSKKDSQSKHGSPAYVRYTPNYHLTIDTGVVFHRVSIGINEDGEQPASYDVTRVKVPLEINYIF